jgi:hypothetical protein
MAIKVARDAKRREVRLHFTNAELDEMEKRARSFSRMDWCDKVKLISQARYAIRLEKAFEKFGKRMLRAVGGDGLEDEIAELMGGNDGE